MQQVTFTRMDEGTAEDYQLTKVEEDAMIAAFPDSVLGWLKEMDVPSAYQITRFLSIPCRQRRGPIAPVKTKR
jgi:hypothetical protein